VGTNRHYYAIRIVFTGRFEQLKHRQGLKITSVEPKQVECVEARLPFAEETSSSDLRELFPRLLSHSTLCFGAKKQSAKASRILSRFHAHKLIAKIPRTRRWRVTDRGKQIMAASLCLRDIAFPELFRKNIAA
jgi:hypothetical protein